MKRPDVVARTLAVLVTLMMLGLLGRVAQLQLAPGERLAAHVSSRVTSHRVLHARGDVLDRRGRPLASTVFRYRVVIDPVTVEQPPGRTIVELSSELGIEPDELGERIIDRLIENENRGRVRRAMGLGVQVEQSSTPDAGAIAGLIRKRLGFDDSDATATVEAAHDEDDPDFTDVPKLIRYLPLDGLYDLTTAERVRALGLPGVFVERRAVRETAGAEEVASILGKAGAANGGPELQGLIGVERMLGDTLDGKDGELRYVRDARGRPLWIEAGAWNEGEAGQTVRLSIDLELQRIAHEELMKGIEHAGAAGGRLVMVDPVAGEILAMVDIMRDLPGLAEYPWRKLDEAGNTIPGTGQLPADVRARPRYRALRPDPNRAIHPGLGRNRCVEDVYEPGSTFKPFVWALAKQRGVLKDGEIVETPGGMYRTPYGRLMRDVTKRDSLSWDEVLVYSSNAGMAQLVERLSFSELRRRVLELGFGRPTGVGVPGESGGLVTSARDWSKYTQTSVAMGYEVAVTPVQMVRAFSAFARTDELAGTVPEVTLVARGSPGSRPGVARRVMPPNVAERVRDITQGVVQRMDETRRRFGADRSEETYSMFGKSGTANMPAVPEDSSTERRPRGARGYFENQYSSSFIAGAPVSDPRIVVLVVIDDPKPELVRIRQHYGSWVAGPVVRSVVERSLRYMGVEPDLPSEDEAEVASR